MNEHVAGMIRGAILAAVQDQKLGLTAAHEMVRALMPGVSAALFDQVEAEIRQQQAANFSLRKAIIDPGRYQTEDLWYVGPTPGGNWERYRTYLERKGHPGIDSLDDETTGIVALLTDPKRTYRRRKGLVMGNVQSGKTANFAGVIAKAADAGYTLVIVLSGMHDNLRTQTQTRLSKDVFDTATWYGLTDAESDFAGKQHDAQVLFNQKIPMAAVVKKNAYRLGHLTRWLKKVPAAVRAQCPILIIDDEADQATPNTAAEQKVTSGINRKLRQLIEAVPTGTYLAYTATPFANVFMDPDDEQELFPSDFIMTIPTGPGYFGAERIFGVGAVDESGEAQDGLAMVRKITSAESTILKPPSGKEARQAHDPEPPESLRDAVAWFVVASAIRRARGQIDHSSMLVHTTHYVDPHFNMQEQLKQLIAALAVKAKTGDVQELQASWNREKDMVASEATVPLPPWNDVAAQVAAVLADIRVLVDNGASEERLDYQTEKPQTVIAVGGGTLSRGLTLEGLVVSYFTRTTNMYDTLMQMGRWFGYRNGYEDLSRIWVGPGLEDDYAFLARVEQDLRAEIESLRGSELTPAQVGVRVRSHPGRLEITARNKMFHAKTVQVSLSGLMRQTFILDGSSERITERNRAAVERLVAGKQPQDWGAQAQRGLVRGVPSVRVIDFLREFQQHDKQSIFSAENVDLAAQWVEKSAPSARWNVVLAGNSVDFAPDGVTPLGDPMPIAGRPLKPLNRAPLRDSSPAFLNFKAISSPTDRIADIEPALYADVPHTADEHYRAIRRKFGNGEGLVTIYPISGLSRPTTKNGLRMDMPTGYHVLGFAIVFPEVAATASEGTFLSVKTNWEVTESYDEELPAEALLEDD